MAEAIEELTKAGLLAQRRVHAVFENGKELLLVDYKASDVKELWAIFRAEK